MVSYCSTRTVSFSCLIRGLASVRNCCSVRSAAWREDSSSIAAQLRRVVQDRGEHQERLRVERTSSRIGDHLFESNALILYIAKRALLREVAGDGRISRLEQPRHLLHSPRGA